MAVEPSTTNYDTLKPCEIESCSRISATLCHHCSKNVCRRHFFEHAEELVQELNPLADSINSLGERISSFSVKDYKEKPLEKLTQWRDEAIRSINDFYELKKKMLDLLLQENEEIFLQRVKCHIELLDTLKNETAALVKEGDVTFEQLQILKRKLQELEDNVNQTHTSVVYCDAKPLLIDYTLVLLHSITNNYMRDGTLLCADYQMRLNEFYGNINQKWELIYKATRDGSRAADFHRCSDNEGPTMTIIQSQTGDYLFGGYAEISWDCDNKYRFDPAAFLFTLKNPHNIEPTKFLRDSNERNSIGHGKNRGPSFGGVIKDGKHLIDLQISDDAITNQQANTSFPSTYIDTTGKGETLFGGAKSFMVKEIEVYTLLGEMYDDEDESEDEDELEREDEDEGVIDVSHNTPSGFSTFGGFLFGGR